MAEKCALFDTGFVVRTPGALLALIEAQVFETTALPHGKGGSSSCSARLVGQNAAAGLFR